MKDLISVIIPVYNVEPYLDRCMKSIINQTYKNLEIILVDDKSSDRSNQMCLEYLDDERVKLVHGNADGLSGARNVGLDVASGKYVVFVDSDDYASLTMIENLYNCAMKTKADTVIGGYRREIGGHIENMNNMFSGMVYDNSDDIKNNVLKKMLSSNGIDQIKMSVWNVLFSMKVIRDNDIKFPDKKYLCEDIMFDFDYYIRANRVAMSDEIGYCYCLNQNSLSQMYQKNKFSIISFQALEMRRLAKQVGLDSDADIRIDNFYIGNLIHHMKTMVACVNMVGKKECKKEINFICYDNMVTSVHWENIKKSYSGRDNIPFYLMKEQKTEMLYIYLRILTVVRRIVSNK